MAWARIEDKRVYFERHDPSVELGSEPMADVSITGRLTAASRASGMLLVLMGLLTLGAAAAHAFAAPEAADGYWLVAAPLGVAGLLWYGRDDSRRRWTALIVVALAALTFGAGGAFGTITAADSALGIGLVLLGGVTRTTVLLITGAGMAASAIVLSGLDGADAWTALSTGLWLVTCGAALSSRLRWIRRGERAPFSE